METFRKLKKGFTIVELVIVIAVIAILAAVLVPTFANLINKANVSADTQLVRNLNTALALDNKEHKTMQSALDTTAESGFDVTKISAKAVKGDILWDGKNDVFCYLNDGTLEYIPGSVAENERIALGSADTYKLWKIYSQEEAGAIATESYSVYLAEGWTGTLEVTAKGVDAGTTDGMTSITYKGGTSAKDIVIRTNSAKTTLTVDAFVGTDASDSVYHFDALGKLVVTALDTKSYHEYGKVNYAEVKAGRVVAEENATIEVALVKAKTAYVQEKVSGGIRQAFAASAEIANASPSPDKKQLTYNTTLSEAQNIQIAENAGKASQETAAEEETVSKELETNQTAVAYIKNESGYQYYNSISDAVRESANNDTINVIRDSTLTEVLTIADKSLTFIGKGTEKPTITGAIKIENSGSKTVAFDNIKFTNNAKSHHLMDRSTCNSEENVNYLIIQNCLFYEIEDARNTTNDQRCIVAICNSQEQTDRTGTKLIFKNNIVKTIDYEDGRTSAYYTSAISVTGNSTQSYGSNIYSYAVHEIEGNQFLGQFHSIIAGGNAVIKNNVFDGKYLSGNEVQLSSRAFQFRGVAPKNPQKAQFNIDVNNNVFKNMKQLFKLYNLDTVVGQEGVYFEVSNTNNRFENVGGLGEADGSAANMLTTYAIEWRDRTWTGISDSELKVVLDQIAMERSGTLETDYMTLSDGTPVMTYTQAVKPENGDRTGYYLTVGETKYWYFCTFNGNVNYFLKDGTNELYVAILGGGGNCTSLSLNETTFSASNPEPDWLKLSADQKTPYKYADGKDHSKDKSATGAIYKSNFTISVLDYITIYNGNATLENNKITVTAGSEDADASKKINLFFSTIGNYSKLLITSNSGATGDAGTLVVIVPGAIGQLVVNGTYEVVIDVDIANINVLGAQKITVNTGKSVSGILKVTAQGNTVVNDGTIGKLYVFAKSSVTNNGTITTLLVGDSRPGGIVAKLQTVKDAHEAVITNNGTITTLNAITKITLTNNAGKNIEDLTIGFLGHEKALSCAKGSSIINNGNMCQANGNIRLYVQCNFTNAGTIGKDNSTCANAGATTCDNIGGCIIIGYHGYRDIHDGIVFTNSGTIYAGARHNGTMHQQITFWIWGVKTGYGTTAPSVTISNETVENRTGTIEGVTWISDCNIAANYSIPNMTIIKK